MTHHLLIAHGSPDPRHKAMMRTLAGRVDDRGLPCSAAYLEHDAPGVAEALSVLAGPVVTLGMLLAPGYHATVDVPSMLIGAPVAVTVDDRGPLGTGPWLLPTLDWLLADVGAGPDSRVILATAGSTRPDAQDSLARFASEWQQTREGRVVVAAATGPGLSLEDAAAEHAAAVVLPFMIAPGVLADRAAQVAERRGLLTTGTLAESPPFVEALVGRLTG
jgi:sirohydrochlorin ferrochelatase